MHEPKELINITKLANTLSVKESWIRSQVFRKSIPHYKVGGLLRFDLNEIYQWIEGTYCPSYDINSDLGGENE